jgi:hypothetical protein
MIHWNWDPKEVEVALEEVVVVVVEQVPVLVLVEPLLSVQVVEAW